MGKNTRKSHILAWIEFVTQVLRELESNNEADEAQESENDSDFSFQQLDESEFEYLTDDEIAKISQLT